MVFSKIDTRIKYDENRMVYDEDIGFEANLYEILPDALEYKIKVAVGKIKYTYVDKNVIFFPVYLLNEEDIVMRIGVYEIVSSKVTELLNDVNDMDLTKLTNYEPLLFKFATKDTLREYSLDKPKVNIKVDDDDKTEEVDDSKLFSSAEIIGPSELQTEDNEESKKLRDEFVDRTNSTWIEKFMQNNNYNLLDNDGEGDCFFYSIRDAFLGLGRETTVNKLRTLLSDEADDETFMQYKMLYEGYKSSLVSSKEESDKIKKELQTLKDKFKLTRDRDTQIILRKNMEEQVKEFNRIKSENEITKENLKEVKIMQGVKTLEQFRKKIKSCDFWADTWAISTMERVLNIKFILLSSEAFENEDKANVLVCGQMNDAKLSQLGIFKPDHYVMLDFLGDHYRVITYKNKRILTFDEIPFDLKRLILMKCMESNDGYYNLIPEFMALKEQYQKDDDIKDDSMETNEELFDPEEKTIFQIYSKSNDKPLPGKGSGEKLEVGDKRFGELNKIVNWRRKLYNSWESPFELDDKQWNSVDHYVNANKFKDSMEFYEKFALDSNSEISKNVDMANEAGGVKKTKLRPKDVEIDSDFEERKSVVIEKALNAKFKIQNFKDILLKTQDAKIVEYKRGAAAETLKELMRVRKKILN
jgi:predicted NAD-dependent protein-ADP-ribosyltransferase YbiA (DUF1768 family)